MSRLNMLLVALITMSASSSLVLAGTLNVTAVEPAAHGLTAPVGASITVHFDQPVDPKSIDTDSFWVFGRWSGMPTGTYSFANGNQSVTFDPSTQFSSGEQVLVILSNEILSASGDPLRDAGYSYQFWTRARPAAMDFSELQVLDTNGDGPSSRPYGGIGSDLNNDGWLDITVVNEDTADLRTFLNNGAGDGMFVDDFEIPAGVNDRASPSEPADFNRDGNVDICVANINTDSISILLGNGDGTFGPDQEINVGDAPRGIAVLDADGDGDIDVVNTNSGSGNLSIMFNDGTGTFGAPTFFEGGGAGEWALVAADMTSDGILDLIVGARSSQTIIVNRGNGDGTFTPLTPAAAGGNVWMLVFGDVDGDGFEDIATANSSQNNGGILLGDGAGNLTAAQTFQMDFFPLATDLADLDGDGDLDWLTASFNGDWWLYTNDGTAGFAFDREFVAPSNASCSVALDIDNDGDLDLALIDEIVDVVEVHTNGGPAVFGDLNGDGSVGPADLAAMLDAWGACVSTCPADLNGDGVVGPADLAALLDNWT